MNTLKEWILENIEDDVIKNGFTDDLSHHLKVVEYHPIDLYSGFESEIEEILEEESLKMAESNVFVYIKDIYGVLEFESHDDYKTKAFEQAVNLTLQNLKS